MDSFLNLITLMIKLASGTMYFTVKFTPTVLCTGRYYTIIIQVIMFCFSLHLDASYNTFHQAEEYPMPKYLKDPLFFEVELMSSTNPEVSLELVNCWATLQADRMSVPRWDLVVSG